MLDGLVVDTTWRRRGIGKLLTRAIETWALDLGAPWIELNVYEFNAEARCFYEEQRQRTWVAPHLRARGCDMLGGTSRAWELNTRAR